MKSKLDNFPASAELKIKNIELYNKLNWKADTIIYFNFFDFATPNSNFEEASYVKDYEPFNHLSWKIIDFLWHEEVYGPDGFYALNWMYWEYLHDIYYYLNSQMILSEKYFFYLSSFREWAFWMVSTIFSWEPKKSLTNWTKKLEAGEYRHGLDIVYSFFWYRSKNDNYLLRDYQDIQDFAIDKNFFLTWRYWKPWRKTFDTFAYAGLYSEEHHRTTRLILPMLHYPSKYSSLKSSLTYFWTRERSLSVFPDCAMCRDDSNYVLDSLSNWYTRMFKTGRTYFDFLFFIEKQRHYAANIDYGGYDYLVADIHVWQAVYFPHPDAGARFALQALITRNHTHAGDFQSFIYNYDWEFNFTRNPIAKKYLKAKFLLKRNRLEWIKLFRDMPDEIPFLDLQEKILAAFFGYNSSLQMFYKPKWSLSLFTKMDFYVAMTRSFYEDERREEVDDMATQKIFDYLNTPSLDYSHFIEYKAFKAPPFYIGSILHFLNEKIHNDPGYFHSLLNFTFENIKSKSFSVFDFFDVIYTTNLITKNYSWFTFYSPWSFIEWSRLNYPKIFFLYLYEELFYLLRYYWIEIKPMAMTDTVIGFTRVRYSTCHLKIAPVFFTIEFPELIPYCDKILEFFTFVHDDFHILIDWKYEKFFHLILSYLPSIIRNEFMWSHPRMEISYFASTNKFIKVACVDWYSAKPSFLPLNFFLFNTQGNISPLWINRIKLENCPFESPLISKDLFVEYTPEEIIPFLKVWGIHQFNNPKYFNLDSDFLLTLATINNNQYRINKIGLQRYQDYVIKRTTFYKHEALR